MTSADEVVATFTRAPDARRRLDNWRVDPHKREVVPQVMAHRSHVVEHISADDVRAVCNRTEHALGEVKRSVGESVIEIVNWHPPFAFIYTLHAITEELGALPTWGEFKDLSQRPHLRRTLWEPAQEMVNQMVRQGVRNDVAHDAMHWRVGNAYYSFIREQYVHAMLREQGVPLLQHPLADALFRVDGWRGHTTLDLFIANRNFRDGIWGRKSRSEDILRGAEPPFTAFQLQMRPQSRFGEVHLPSDELIKMAAARLRGA